MGARRLPARALEAGDSAKAAFTITPRQMSVIGDDGSRVLKPGRFRLFAGAGQPDERTRHLEGSSPLSAEFSVTGAPLRLPYQAVTA